MKKHKKIQTILVVILRVAVIFLIAVIIFKHNHVTNSDQVDTNTVTIKANPLEINDNVRNDGIITIIDSNNVVQDQYGGAINIKNDGRDGEQIEIEVMISAEDGE